MHFRYDKYGKLEYINFLDEAYNAEYDTDEKWEAAQRRVEEKMREHNVIFIYGGCFAIHVTFRTKEKDGTDNPLYTIMVEDDEQLFILHEPTFDYAWSTNLTEVLEEAHKFVEEKKNESNVSKGS